MRGLFAEILTAKKNTQFSINLWLHPPSQLAVDIENA
jgi:hypothetical protein